MDRTYYSLKKSHTPKIMLKVDVHVNLSVLKFNYIILFHGASHLNEFMLTNNTHLYI